MALFLRQIYTLLIKNLVVTLLRHWLTTPVRAFFLPCIFVGFLSYARYLFIPPSIYGIGVPTPIRDLPSALDLVSSDRNKLIFVNNGFTGGAIERVIQEVAESARRTGKHIEILTKEEQLLTTCRSTLRGTSTCVAAAVFFSSPHEGPGGRWNYTLRADGALESKIVVNSNKNDVEIYALPLQHAIDAVIARSEGGALPEVFEYPYTSLTPAQRQDNIRTRYMDGIIDILAVAFFIGMVGVAYQLTGLIATEREIGMAQLLDCMMPNTARWQPQMARIISSHLAFDILYGPGWIVMAIILSVGVFSKTSAGIMIVFNLLSGLAMSSFAIFGASFFHRAQLSGITSVIVSLLLAVVAQVASKAGTGSVAVLSLLFPPMNYVYFTILMARYERQDEGTNLVKSAPDNTSSLPGIVFWIFNLVQIVGYPLLGALVERWLYGTASRARQVVSSDSSAVVSLSAFSKLYRPTLRRRVLGGLTKKPAKGVLAVDGLSLDAIRGQILVLLGANGSGKSTTLDAISGLTPITSGGISLNFSGQGGLGLCPQKNVLWDELTVEEHARIFNRVKSSKKADIQELLRACDIDGKAHAKAKTLSGGQKRKTQLAMMFTGGSSLCCVDEVSSGLDPISRSKIWEILLAERGQRSIILTTHFLDEAEALSDHIAILSKGVLRAEGSSVELKRQLGSGYHIHVHSHEKVPDTNVPYRREHDQLVYGLEDSASAARFITELDQQGFREYQVQGPTIEDVFLKVEETENKPKLSPDLQSGKRISMFLEAWVLFRKRLTIFRRNYLPYTAAFLIPVIAAGLVTLYLNGFEKAGCDPSSTTSISDISSLISQAEYDIVLGPRDRILSHALKLPGHGSVHLVDSLQDFNEYIGTRFANLTPGGFFLGDGNTSPIFAWRGNGDISFPVIIQNTLDGLQTNISIGSQYQPFNQPWGASVGHALLLITYFGLAMSIYPAFLGLYPTVERLRKVRALHYSNGVRPVGLWLAYISFDFMIVLAVSVLAVIILGVSADVWYHIEYLFVVLFLYGLASTLLAYTISLFSKSQLATFAFAAAGQVVMFLVYYIAFMSVLTYSPIDKIDRNVNIAHFTIASISPVGNLLRAMFLGLNVFSVTCRDRAFASYPGAVTVYGGPILYLVLQSLGLFGLLVWWDAGPKNFKGKAEDEEEGEAGEGLRVSHLTKRFKKTVAVDNVSFGVPKGEVFALLGPNGAGKSTTISLIRGDLRPTEKGQVMIDDISLFRHRAAARSRLGVCPQFDAMDVMTVREHLDLYARIRGVPNPKHNVKEIMRAVGIEGLADRMAAKLSGGNKRKLSLGMALTGNPRVLLLDEPSSGMDAASKRVMWRTLEGVADGRSIVLTTHSMEEADALAQRAGIMAGRMLASGTTDYLRREYGNAYYVHLVHCNAPHSSDQEMKMVYDWIVAAFPAATVEEKTYHGQMRFSVPLDLTAAQLFALLEENKSRLGIEDYSVGQATLDQVFLNIVRKYNVEEEGGD